MDQQNALLRAIQSGLVDPAQLDDQQLAQLLPTPQPRFDVAPMQQNTMRVENGPDAGQVTNLNFSGQPGTPQAPSPDQPSGSMADLMAKFAAAKQQQQPSQQMPNLDLSGQGGPKIMQGGGNPQTMRVVGSGNGAVVDLGTEPAQPPSLDYARGKIDIPGVGRGYYGKDGNAYVQNPDGSITKALLGYDMQGSMQLNKYALDQQKTAADIAHTQEATRASKVMNPDWMGSGDGAGGIDLGGVAPGMLAQAKAIAAGDSPIPASRNGRLNPLAALAYQINPDLKATDYIEKQATVKDFSPQGQSGKVVQSMNQALHHAALVASDITALNNSDTLPGLINPIKNTVGPFVNGKYTAPGDFGTDAKALSEELNKIYAGGGGSLEQLKQWQASFNPNASETQQKSYLQHGMELLQGAISSRKAAYERGQGVQQIGRFSTLIDPEAQKALDMLTQKGFVNPDAFGYSPQSGGSSPVKSSVGLSVPANAVAYLRAHPEARGEFDAKFGPGSSAQILGR